MKRKVEANEFSHLFRMVMLAILLALNGCFVSSNLIAQNVTVTGTVKNALGETLPGVSIVVKGTTNGTISDLNGKYSISKVAANAVLSFSFVGRNKRTDRNCTFKSAGNTASVWPCHYFPLW